MNENGKAKPFLILVAEDNEDDYFFISRALDKIGFDKEVHWVKDGEELTDYLNGKCKYRINGESLKPDLILLDINMPKKDGFEALKEIKADKNFNDIFIFMLTSSTFEGDIFNAYEYGADSYISKSADYVSQEKSIKAACEYYSKLGKLL